MAAALRRLPTQPAVGTQTETKGQGQQGSATAEAPTSGPLVEVSHVQCGKDRGEHGHQAPREKEGCVSKLQIKAREEQKKKKN